MQEEDIRHFIWVCTKPGMYVQSTHFEVVCAYINGYDTALRGGSLVGFREWLLTRGVERTNLPWWALVRRQTLPEKDLSATLSDTENEQLLMGLASALELYAKCLSHDGLDMIFHAYHSWSIEQKTNEYT